MENNCIKNINIPTVDNNAPYCEFPTSETCVMINGTYPFVRNPKDISLSEFLTLMMNKLSLMKNEIVELRKEVNILKQNNEL